MVFDYEDQMKVPLFKKQIEELTSEAVKLRFILLSSQMLSIRKHFITFLAWLGF